MAHSVYGFCVNCKKEREMKDTVALVMPGRKKGSRNAIKGVCPVCEAPMFKLLEKDQ